jgi:hypothetical protein
MLVLGRDENGCVLRWREPAKGIRAVDGAGNQRGAAAFPTQLRFDAGATGSSLKRKWSHVINIPFVLALERKTVALIKTIGCAVAQCAHADRHLIRAGLGDQAGKGRCLPKIRSLSLAARSINRRRISYRSR